MVTFALQGAFRGIRDTRSPLAPLALTSLANVALDALFVLPFAGKPLAATAGLLGAALATVLAQFYGTVALFRGLSSKARATPPKPSIGGVPFLLLLCLPWRSRPCLQEAWWGHV